MAFSPFDNALNYSFKGVGQGVEACMPSVIRNAVQPIMEQAEHGQVLLIVYARVRHEEAMWRGKDFGVETETSETDLACDRASAIVLYLVSLRHSAAQKTFTSGLEPAGGGPSVPHIRKTAACTLGGTRPCICLRSQLALEACHCGVCWRIVPLVMTRLWRSAKHQRSYLRLTLPQGSEAALAARKPYAVLCTCLFHVRSLPKVAGVASLAVRRASIPPAASDTSWCARKMFAEKT
jgi:hypothetical protein